MTSERMQALLDEAVTRGAAPGLVAGVLRDGEARFWAAGARGVADPTPMDPDAVFWIASCTKAITSAAALRLVEQGALDLDEPVGVRIPALAEPQVLDGTGPDGRPRLRAARRPLTLRSLLSHTSGLAYDFFSAELAGYFAATGGSLAGSLASGPPLVFEPGEGWQYGIGIDVAGWLIEHATGQTLAAHLDEAFFRPLGMTSSSFEPGPDLTSRMAGMHRRGADGGFEPADRFPSAPVLHGGGGLNSTAGDYLRFLAAVMADDGGGVLGPAALRGLREPAAHAGQAGCLATTMPPLSHDFRPMPGTPLSWTLGFLRNDADVPGARRAGSLAWGGLANCYYWADPASGVAGVLFGQFLPFADPGMLATFEAVERAAYEA